MIRVLTILNDELNKMNIPYTFDEWDKEIELPQFIGELSETPVLDEDGKSEYTFILNGYATDIVYLFEVVEQLKKRYKPYQIVDGVIVAYNNAQTIDNGTDDLKQIEIRLNIKEWSV